MLSTKRLAVLLGLASSRVLGQYCEHQWEGKFSDQQEDGVAYLDGVESTAAPPLEIRPLIISGPSKNRVDLIFFGDGCEWGINDLACLNDGRC